MMKRLSMVWLMLSLGACTLGPDHQSPGFGPWSGWKRQSGEKSAQILGEWWRLFGDSRLDALVKQALSEQPSLHASRARVEASRALVGVDRARLFPVLNFNGSAATQRFSQDAVGAQLPAGLNIPLERARYQGGLDLTFDVDLWGAQRRRLEAAEAEAEAAVQVDRGQRLGLAAEVVRQYALWCGLERQARGLREVVASWESSSRLEKEQQEAGLLDAVQVSASASALEMARHDLAMVERQFGATQHALAVLCGQSPAQFRMPKAGKSLRVPSLSAGTTAEVLARRPDVAAAEHRLRAANARIGVATAAFYPNFTLFGSGGYESINPARFLDWQNRVFALGSGVSLPVFRGGSNRAAWQASVAARDEALAEYRNTLLVALREVEDALLDVQMLARSQAALQKARVHLRDSRDAIRERQKKGVASRLEREQLERQVLALELQLAEVESQQAISAAMLCKALGGGW